MMDADFDDYDINSHELVAMPEDVRNEFFGMFDDHNTIDDVLLSKTKSNPEDRFKASVLYIQYKGSNLTEMDISGIIEANRGSDEIARIIVEAKGDKLEYSDIISIIRKVKYPNAFADNPYFVKGLRRLMADNDMLYSVLNSAIFDSNSNALKKVLLLVKPTAILDKNGPKYNNNPQHSKLSDNPKEDMKKKIKEAGITL